MSPDIKKELNDEQVILEVIKSDQYNEVLKENLKKLSGKRVLYLSFNKTYESLKETFKKSKINIRNIIFVDAISKTIKKTPDFKDQCFYCSNPGALTEISLIVTKLMKYDFDYIIFDSLNNLMVYQKPSPIVRFVSSTIHKIKSTDTKAIFYALDVGEHQGLIEQVGSYVDKTIYSNK